MSSYPISTMLLIIGICLAFANLSLALQEGQSPAVDGCQKDKFVPPVNTADCPNEDLTLKYLPVLAPNKNAKSKLSKRFQILNDECIGKNGKKKIDFPGHPLGNAEGFKQGMQNGAMLADYLGVWMLSLDLKYVPNCPNMVTNGNCELKCHDNEFHLLDKKSVSPDIIGPTPIGPVDPTATTDPLFVSKPFTHVFANELKGGEQITVHGRISSNFVKETPRIGFLYNAKNDEPRNLLIPKDQQNEQIDLMETNLILGEWLIKLLFDADENGNGTLPMLLNQEITMTDPGFFGGKVESLQGTKTTQIGNFVVNPGVPFELHIDVPSTFKNEGEGEAQVEMEHYRAELKYDGAKKHGALEFGLNRKHFPLWQIQAISFENVESLAKPMVECVKGTCKMQMQKETDYAISIVHLNEVGKQKTGGLLKPGDRITINGNVPADATEFSINFCFLQDNCVFSDSTVEAAHPINANAKSGDNALQIRLYGDKWAIRYWTRWIGKWTDFKEETDTPIADKIDTPFAKAAPFQIDIDILLSGYTIDIGGKTTIQIDTNAANTILPPWSADHIFIYGDVKVASDKIIRAHQPRELELPHVVRLERELVPNCVIKIHGKPRAHAEWDQKLDGMERTIFSIGLYHDALEHNPEYNTQRLFIGCKVGETVLEIDFRAVASGGEKFSEGIALFAYYRQYEKGHKELVNAELEDGQAKSVDGDWAWSKLTFVEIHVFEDRFDIITDHKPEWKLSMPNHLPLWASQYLTVKGMFTLEKEIDFTGCQ